MEQRVWLRDRLHRNDNLGGLDRAFGVLFGLGRAFILVGVFHLIFHAVTPAERLPHWFKDAKLYRASATAAKVIQIVLPEGAKVADRVAPKVEQSVREGVAAHPTSRPRRPAAYDQTQRDHMDALVEQSR